MTRLPRILFQRLRLPAILTFSFVAGCAQSSDPTANGEAVSQSNALTTLAPGQSSLSVFPLSPVLATNVKQGYTQLSSLTFSISGPSTISLSSMLSASLESCTAYPSTCSDMTPYGIPGTFHHVNAQAHFYWAITGQPGGWGVDVVSRAPAIEVGNSVPTVLYTTMPATVQLTAHLSYAGSYTATLYAYVPTVNSPGQEVTVGPSVVNGAQTSLLVVAN